MHEPQTNILVVDHAIHKLLPVLVIIHALEQLLYEFVVSFESQILAALNLKDLLGFIWIKTCIILESVNCSLKKRCIESLILKELLNPEHLGDLVVESGIILDSLHVQLVL